MEWYDKLGICVLVFFVIIGIFQSCSSQSVARNWGGEEEMSLPPNQKLVMISWKDSSLWYLTKPMTEDDIAETYTFQQSSNLGVFEGKVVIHEVIMTEEELMQWEEEQRLLMENYHNDSSDEYPDPYMKND